MHVVCVCEREIHKLRLKGVIAPCVELKVSPVYHLFNSERMSMVLEAISLMKTDSENREPFNQSESKVQLKKRPMKKVFTN